MIKKILYISAIFMLSGCWFGRNSFLHADNKLPNYVLRSGSADDYKVGLCVFNSNANFRNWAKNNTRPLSSFAMRGRLFNECMEEKEWD